MATDSPRRRDGTALAVLSLCLVQFVDVLGVTVVVTSLPHMLADLHAPGSAGSLIATGYAMFFGGLLMLGARLGDRFGHRRTILASLAVFAAGAVVSATAGSIVALTAGRCLQGAAAAGSVPSALRLLTTVAPAGQARRRAIAAWSAAGAAAGSSGFIIGGIVTDLTSWRLIFWAYLPLAAVLAAAIWASVPPGRDADGRTGPGRSLNLTGSALFTGAVMAFVLGTTAVAQAADRVAGIALLAVSVALTVAFAAVDRRAAAPLLPTGVLRSARLRLGTAGGFLNTATTSSVITLVTLYLQSTLHRSPLEAAATLLPFSLAVIGGSALSAAVLRRIRPAQAVAAGLALIAAADLALIPAAGSAWAVPACAAVAGAGIGLSSVAATGLGTDVEECWRGTASGIINTAAQLGTALGISLLLLIAAASTGIPAGGSPAPAPAWAVAAAVAAAGAVVFARAGRRDSDRTRAVSSSLQSGGACGRPGPASTVVSWGC